MFGILADSTGIRFNPLADKYVNLLLDNADTGYAEVLASLSLYRCVSLIPIP